LESGLQRQIPFLVNIALRLKKNFQGQRLQGAKMPHLLRIMPQWGRHKADSVPGPVLSLFPYLEGNFGLHYAGRGVDVLQVFENINCLE
jgi:hypothetical protein